MHNVCFLHIIIPLESSQKKCLWFVVCAFQCQETILIPTKSFACVIYRCMLASLSQALPLKKVLFLHLTKMSRYYATTFCDELLIQTCEYNYVHVYNYTCTNKSDKFTLYVHKLL